MVFACLGAMGLTFFFASSLLGDLGDLADFFLSPPGLLASAFLIASLVLESILTFSGLLAYLLKY